ncbi:MULTISPECIES: hypothetical protein [Nostoc]|uniref:Uncharacterized protein n=1 Tax=Nostoc paludosum FACHB-159 TaxID=2692908 RepID=A0ABR8KCZ2_9NOSO|nr:MULTISPECIES: hypothetical protein [Nostoc]MBD2736724.1 hypothetical protein [Nostoc paludosum FACHB-159]
MNILADDSNNIVCISNKIYFHQTCVLYQQQASKPQPDAQGATINSSVSLALKEKVVTTASVKISSSKSSKSISNWILAQR